MNTLLTVLSGPLAPGLAAGGLILGSLPWLPRNTTWARAVIIAIGTALMWRYMAWRLLVTLPAPSFSSEYVVGLTFGVAEALTVAGTTLTLFFLTKTRSRSADADAGAAWLKAQGSPLVDVFICTYNEEQAILDTTITAALAMNYRRFRVWILDDGRRPWLKALCAQKGCNYLTRPDNAGAKAGNINHALAHVARLTEQPEFVAVLDADFAPMANFLSRTLALFEDPQIGLVQTPQHFSNPDPIQANLAVAQVFPDEQRFFFDVIMPSRDAWGVAFCCGTSSIMRFASVQMVGGIPTDSVTEDYLLTLRLHESGLKTVYLDERLSAGLAPEGLKEYATQRTRWCLGFIQICRGRYNPLRFNNGLSLLYRVSLVDAFLFWSASFVFRLFCLIIPLLYWIFGIRAVHAELGDALSYFLPYFVSQIAATMWLGGGRILPLMADVSQLLVVLDILRAVAVGLVKSRGHKFKVTSKGGQRNRRIVQWRLLLQFAGLALLTWLGIAYSFLIDDTRFIEEGAALALFWSWYNLIVLSVCCMVCIEQPRYRKDERHTTGERARVLIGTHVREYKVLDISAGGARLSGPLPEPIGTPVLLSLDHLQVPAVIVRKNADGIGLRIEGEEARAAMLRHVYSGRYGSAVLQVHGAKLAVKIVQRALR